LSGYGFSYEKYGKDPEAALRQAQITPELLCLRTAGSASQMETISGLAMQELDDEALGWLPALPWGCYGMLCRASSEPVDDDTSAFNATQAGE